MLIFPNSKPVHDLWKVFTKHGAIITKGESERDRRRRRTGDRGRLLDENLWKGVSGWIKSVGGVKGGRDGPVTPDLLPPRPFRAAQWLTPVSFHGCFYYYLHQERGRQNEARGAVKQAAPAWCQQHLPPIPLLPLAVWKTSAHISLCLRAPGNLFLANYFT